MKKKSKAQIEYDKKFNKIVEKLHGKKTDISEYRLQQRGGTGVKAMNTTDKTGDLVALDAVSDDNDILVTTKQGIVIRCHVDSISKTSRATQGVKIITIKNNTEIASIAVFDKAEDDDSEALAPKEENPEVAEASEAKEE